MWRKAARLRSVEHHVLPGEDPHADAGEVEAVEESPEIEVGGRVLWELERIVGVRAAAAGDDGRRGPAANVHFLEPASDEGLHVVVSNHKPLELLTKGLLLSESLGNWQAPQRKKTVFVELDYLCDGRGLTQPKRKSPKLTYPPASESDMLRFFPIKLQ